MIFNEHNIYIVFRKVKIMGTQDRRIRKTRTILKNSLIELMNEKSVKHITVKELCEKADINRGTFYLHYKDVFDMLEKIEEEFFQELSSIIEVYAKDMSVSKKPFLKELFAFIKENKNFCLVMLSGHGDIGFLKMLQNYLHDTTMKVYGKNTPTAEHYYYFLIYGCIGLIENWLTTNTKESPEEMASLSENIILNGIKQYL
jgi:AcrR family transcriptional regulator